MKNYDYNGQEFGNYFDALETIRTDLKNLEYPFDISHRTFGSGKLTSLEAPIIGSSLHATVEFTSGTKKLALETCLNLGVLSGSDTYMETLSTYQNVFRTLYEVRVANACEESRLERERQIKLKKEAEEAAKLEEKKRKLDLKIRDLKPINLTSDYALIGWLASHVSTISATVNSDYEVWFQKNFGIVNHTVIDAKEKTKRGDPMKYSLSFRASFKSDLPALLQRREGVKAREINSVEYIWDLIDRYGFRFGKTQDIEAIRKCIPDTYLEDFERGLTTDPVVKKTRKAKAKAAA